MDNNRQVRPGPGVAEVAERYGHVAGNLAWDSSKPTEDIQAAVITVTKGSRLAGYRKVLVTVLTMVAVGAIGVTGAAPQWTAQLLTVSGVAYALLNVIQKYVQVR